MIHASTATAASERPFRTRLATLIRHLPQRIHEPQFWIVQAGVLSVTATHIAAERWASHADLDVPSALHHLPVILYLAPISYASLKFGTEGAVLTGLWSAVLTMPNLLIWHREDYGWLEVLYVTTVVLAGVIMSVPVERERQQRQRAEATNQRLALLDDIATLTLTAGLQATLDETLRRLHDILGLEASCVGVEDQAAAGAGLSVLACQPSGRVGAALRACLDPSRPAPADVVVVPLRAELPGPGPGHRVNGLLAAKLDPARPFTADDRQLLDGVASHLAVAVANESLTESERNRLRSYVKLVTEALEDERKRIARELHDEAAQNVVVIRRGLAALRATLDDHPAAAELGELSELAGQTIAGIRRFSRDLRPPTLDELGLVSALDQLVIQVRERSSTLAAQLRVSGPPRRLPIETELAVFRIGQAAIHNVERHASAAKVDVGLTFEPDRVRLEVVDDGCGFEPPQNLAALPEGGKLGLIGMHERAQLVGGWLEIHSRPSAGTRVVLEVPDASSVGE